MKIRNGFVSNSSSSSFIVVFNKKPKSIEEVCKILYGDSKSIKEHYGDRTFETMKLAEIVYSDVTNPENKAKLKSIVHELADYWIYHYDVGRYGEKSRFPYLPKSLGCDKKILNKIAAAECEQRDKEEQIREEKRKYKDNHKKVRELDLASWIDRKHHDKIQKLNKEIATKDAKKFMKEHSGKYIAIVSYADEDGSVGCQLEHGGTFNNIPHITISKH